MTRLSFFDEKKRMLDAFEMFTNDCRANLIERLGSKGPTWDKLDVLKNEDIAHEMLRDALAVVRKNDKHRLCDIANNAMILWIREYKKEGTEQ